MRTSFLVLCKLLLFILCVDIYAGDVQVTAQVDMGSAWESQPISGTITVTRDMGDKIDEKSFQMGGKSLDIDKVRSVRVSPESPLMLDIYTFSLPGQPAGLQMLPAVSVKVGGKVYQSIASSYMVQKAEAIPPVQSARVGSAQKGDPNTLRLKSLLDIPHPFYPGQRGWLTYLYFYSGDIALTKEDLPLLDPTGFLKVGDKRIQEAAEGTTSIREISQRIQAQKPGQFSFPSSVVEGYAYEEDPILKTRTYLQPKLHSQVDAVSIEVVPFPQNGQPSNFQGAVGQFTFTSALLTPSKVIVDDKVQLLLEIKGEDNLWTVQLPSTAILQGLFRQSDLPPPGKVEGNTKQFIVEIYPLSSAVTEIPSLAFSYFDPLQAKYVELHSKSIPLEVVERKPYLGQQPSSPTLPSFQEKTVQPQEVTQPKILPMKELADSSPLLVEALQQYRRGEQAKTIEEAKEAFNEALASYLKEEQKGGEIPRGEFYYNLGNIFFQLQEYPRAVASYYQAQQMQPRDRQIQHNLEMTQQALALPTHIRNNAPLWIVSSVEMWRITWGVIAIFIILLLCYIFKRSRGWRNSAILFGIFTLLLCSALAYTRYFAPIEAVFIQSTLLYRYPEENAEKIGINPVLAGTKIKVLEVSQEGKWLKVLTDDKQLGYAPYTTLRLLSSAL